MAKFDASSTTWMCETHSCVPSTASLCDTWFCASATYGIAWSFAESLPQCVVWAKVRSSRRVSWYSLCLAVDHREHAATHDSRVSRFSKALFCYFLIYFEFFFLNPHIYTFLAVFLSLMIIRSKIHGQPFLLRIEQFLRNVNPWSECTESGTVVWTFREELHQESAPEIAKFVSKAVTSILRIHVATLFL